MNEEGNRALEANHAIEANLHRLGVTGAGLVGALVVTLLAVQLLLGNQIAKLQEEGVAGALVIAQLEQATGNLHARQTQLVATTSTAEVAAVSERAPLEARLQTAIEELAALHPARAPGVRSQAETFLQTDEALSRSVEGRHTLDERARARRAEVDGELRGIIEAAGGLAGVARLDTVLLLRRLVRQPGNARIGREVIFGNSRLQQESVAGVVAGVLRLGGLVGRLGLTEGRDALNDFTANALPQNTAATTLAMQKLVEAVRGDAALEARTTELQEKIAAVYELVASPADASSLVSLQGAMLEQRSRSDVLRAQAQASAEALQAELAQVDAQIETAIAGSERTATLVLWGSRIATLILLAFGTMVLLGSRRRIQMSVQSLHDTNEELRRLSDELRDINENLEAQVEERTAQLSARESSLRLVLNSTGDGLVRLGLDGTVEGELSQAAARWLGEPGPDQRIDGLLFPDDPTAAKSFALGLAQFADDFLPFELIADQMSKRIVLRGRHLGLSWRPIHEGGALAGLLLVLSDDSAVVEAERAERAARELQQSVSQLLENPSGYRLFLADGAALVDDCTPETPRPAVLRKLHTLKGNTALMGFMRVADAAHAIEDALAERTGGMLANEQARLREAWEASVEGITPYLPSDSELDIRPPDLEELLSEIADHAPYSALYRSVQRWKLTPARVLLDRLVTQGEALGERLQKPIDVEVNGGPVRLDEPLLELFSSIVHVVRNAIDHGIESAERRQELGKPARGKVTIDVSESAEGLVLDIADDGAGIDWHAVRSKAERLGLEVPDDLASLLFESSFSSRDTVTEISGRGVGLNAVHAMVSRLGGTIEVHSEPNAGTRFQICVPLAPSEQDRSAA